MTTSIPDLSGNTAGVTVGDPKTASEDNVNVVTGSITIAGSSDAVEVTEQQQAFQLVGVAGGSGITLTNGLQSTPMIVPGGAYIWSTQFTGTTTLVLQTLGPDGVTWSNFSPSASMTATGQVGVVIGDNPSNLANVRINNTGANPATVLFSSLS